jgi:hypothetical protein
MCHTYSSCCRFCDAERGPFIQECNDHTEGTCRLSAEAIGFDFALTKPNSYVATAFAYDNLPHARIRVTCTECGYLPRYVLMMMPEAYASIGLISRDSFEQGGTYMCPSLLDGVRTAAKYGLDVLSKMIRNSERLLSFEAVERDYTTAHLSHIPKGEWHWTYEKHLMRRLGKESPWEDFIFADISNQKELAGIGNELKENADMRSNLDRLMRLRKKLLSEAHVCDSSDLLNEYLVLCDPFLAPISHVKVAHERAMHGTFKTGCVTLDGFANRAREWDNYCIDETDSVPPPEASADYIWVDEALGIGSSSVGTEGRFPFSGVLKESVDDFDLFYFEEYINEQDEEHWETN